MIEKRRESILWKPSKVKYIANYINGYPFKPKEWGDHGLPIIRIQNLTDPNAPYNYFDGELPKKYLVKKGDILLSWSASLGAYEWQDTDAWLNQHIFKVDLNSHLVTKKYFKWLAIWFMSELNKEAHGSTMQHVTKDKFGSLKLRLPAKDTQQKIADYLDKETVRIDGLIEAKERMLKLLEEKRRAIINRAVTRGLNLEAPTKPSGLDWLGEIPEHWEIKRLKFLTNYPLDYGANEAALDDNPEYPRFVRITDINEDGTLRPETFKSLEPSIAKKYLLKSGDILFARSGATVGKTFIYNESWGESCFAGYLIRFRTDTNKAFPKYIYYYTLSSMYWNQISIDTIQATIQNFSAEKYGNLLICIPPLNEQKQIVAYIEQFTHKHKILTQELEKSIALLKERRSALIAAAVTGEIDVEGSG